MNEEMNDIIIVCDNVVVRRYRYSLRYKYRLRYIEMDERTMTTF